MMQYWTIRVTLASGTTVEFSPEKYCRESWYTMMTEDIKEWLKVNIVREVDKITYNDREREEEDTTCGN